MNPNIGFVAYLADQDIDGVNELYYIKERALYYSGFCSS